MPKKGWKHSEETKQAMGKYRLGIPLTEEHKNNIRVALSDIQKTPEYRAKISRALMGVPNPIDGLNGASETNHNCKDWWFIKRGKHYRFRSLNKFVRDNKHLFTDEELTEYRSEKRLAPIYRATVMLRQLHLLKKDGTPKVPSFVWNGWTIGEKWEQGFYKAESK